MSRYDDPENVRALFFFYGLVIGTLAAIFGAIWLIDWLFVR
jgi:ABC-type lipoprotein release transport system permease subunit